MQQPTFSEVHSVALDRLGLTNLGRTNAAPEPPLGPDLQRTRPQRDVQNDGDVPEEPEWETPSEWDSQDEELGPGRAEPRHTYDLGLPRAGPYPDRATLKEAVNEYGVRNGYSVNIGQSRGTDFNCELKCDIYGAHREHRPELAHHRQREAWTRKKGCRFKIRARKDTTRPAPHQWWIEVIEPLHNHPAIPPELLSQERRATPEQQRWIQQLQEWGMPRRGILNSLDDIWPGHHLGYRAIQYVHEETKRSKYGGLSSAQYLEHKLVAADVPYNIWTDQESKLTALLVLNPDAIRLYQRLPSVILMDCTYRTNQYNMPALHIMGVSGTGRGFSLGIALLSQETIPFYRAVLTEVKARLGQTTPTAIVTDRYVLSIQSLETFASILTDYCCVPPSCSVNIESRLSRLSSPNYTPRRSISCAGGTSSRTF